MTSRIEELAATVSAPVRGRVFQDATSTSMAYLDFDATVDSIPNYWRNRFIVIQAIGSDLVFAVTKLNSDAIDPAANASAGAPPANGGAYLVAGQERVFFNGTFQSSYRYLAWRAVSTAGRVVIYPGSPPETLRGR